jgi:hypothetical protein
MARPGQGTGLAGRVGGRRRWRPPLSRCRPGDRPIRREHPAAPRTRCAGLPRRASPPLHRVRPPPFPPSTRRRANICGACSSAARRLTPWVALRTRCISGGSWRAPIPRARADCTWAAGRLNSAARRGQSRNRAPSRPLKAPPRGAERTPLPAETPRPRAPPSCRGPAQSPRRPSARVQRRQPSMASSRSAPHPARGPA